MPISTRPWIATVYFYLISAVCIITLIFALAAGLMAVYTLIDPESNLDKYEWKTYADLDEYKRSEMRDETGRGKSFGTAVGDSISRPSVQSEEEWQRRWNTHRATTIRAEKIGARRNLINQFIIVVVCFPIFLIHWRLARRASQAGLSDTDNSVDRKSFAG